MPAANKGRILAGLSMQQTAAQASLSLPKSVINNVLPSILISTDLSMSNSLDDSTFYISYVKSSYSLHYYLFGVITISTLFFYGLIRVACLGMYSRNIELVGHLLALKTVSLVVYPTYAEYVNFCLGFMVVDLPWLNYYLPDSFANGFDTMPMGYLFFFRNMNMASMHFFTCIIFLTLLIIGYCCLSDKEDEEVSEENSQRITVHLKFLAFKEFMLNFFCFGLAFAGFSSVVASFLNNATGLTVNGVFYISGVVIYCMIFSEAFSCLVINRRVGRMRLVLKATFLAGAALNPLYLSSIAMIVDAILITI